MEYIVTQPKDYWVAQNAINITLNALNDPNRIQCSVISGAVVRCFFEHVDEADSLGYTVAHDYHQWPISASPTYFNSNTEKYVYIAIPRSDSVGMQAIVVFPSEKLDIYGRKAVKSTDPETGEETIVYEQIGSTDYFYVWLQAIISAPLLIGGVLQRIWTTQIATGKLDTPQGDAERETDNEWYLWSAIGGFVTFLREIRMSAESWFANIRLGKDKRELTGVATAATSDEFVDSETLVVTPSFLRSKYLSKQLDDTAQGEIGFLKGLWIKAKGLFGFDGDGNIKANDINADGSATVGGDAIIDGDTSVRGKFEAYGQATINDIKSRSYSGTGLADTGWAITNDNGSGSSQAIFDVLTIRKKMIVNSLEIKETNFSAGDVAHTLASAEITRTDYLYIDQYGNETLLGYSQIKVPWHLRGVVMLLGKSFPLSRRLLTHYKEVRLTLTPEQLLQCNRVRCYFLAKDGDREIENWFRANDLARCQTWNVVKTRRDTFAPNLDDHAGNVYWWRKITDTSWNTGVPRYVAKDASGQPTDQTTTNISEAYVNEGGIPRLADNGTYARKPDEKHAPKTIDGDTMHWFDVAFGYSYEQSGRCNWCDLGSDIPAAGDKVIQFGNTTDPDRMNIYMIEVNGAGNPDAPDWKMYRGVYTFNLTNCWWGGESCCKTKWSVATGIEAYAPQFNWITEYGIARQVFVRNEVYWNKIPFERDDETLTRAISSYPDYSDDIVDENGQFVSRADGSPKNFVRKCRYYEHVSHNGSAWLCSIAESFYWRDSNGNRISAKADGAEYVRNYTYDEPSTESNNWTEQVEKGDPGAFKSTVFCRSNSTPAAPSNEKKDGCNTFDNPVPPVVSGQPTWTDGIPDGTAILWASTAWFYSDGTHQNWTAPRQQTDSETLDIEFSPNSEQPSVPVGTAANKDTASTKAQRHDQGWYDPNDTLPSGFTWNDMKWRAERKIKNGVYYGSWAVTRIKGENSIRIDLDNENDSMLYTSGGTLVSGSVLSTARLFDGATNVSTSAAWTMTAVGCTKSSGNSRNIVVTGMTAVTGYVNVQAVYTDKNGTVYTKTTQLTLKKLVDVDKYDLDITPNSIAYNATKDQPETSLLTIKVWKMTVDGNRVLSSPPSGYSVYANNAKQEASSTGTYYYTTDNSAVSSVQVKIAKDSNLDDVLDSETIPVNKSEDGAGGDTPMQAFKWNDSPTSAPALPTKGNYDNGWTATAPNRPAGTAEYHLWMTQAVKHTAADKSVSYDAWGAAVRISGDKGEPGVDSADREWIYIGSKTYSSPYSGTHPKNITKDKNGVQRDAEYIHSHADFVPQGWSDTAIATDGDSNKFVYASWRDRAKGATEWGDFNDPILWSNWGVQGIDGDGVQYVYKLFDHELTDAERVSNIPAKPASQTQGEWIPSGWSDDPLAPTSANPYSYCSVIKKIGGSWSDTFEKLGLWSKWAKDADVWTIDSDGYWCKNGVRYVTPDGNYVLAEGKNGTGVELKGSVDVLFISQASQGQTSLEGVSAKIGECYSVKSTGHLYFYDGTSQESGIPSGWVDVGEFKGEKGENSYVHIAYARSVSFNGSTITAVTGFTVDSNGSDYEWMGMCADNNPLDPGASGRDAGSDLANARFYKWNYMKGKDGNGYERVYLLAKDGVTPTVNQSSYTVTSDKPNYGHTDRTKDEFWPQVANYDSSQMQTSYWTDDPQSNPSEAWPVLWWTERKFDGNTQTWGDFCPPTEHNRFTSELAITLTRDNLYTEASWNTYAAIGHTESFVKRSGDSDFTVCRVGDRFVVSGKSSDKGLYHTATYKCTSVSANNIAGICISHLHDGKGISNVARTFAISNVGTTESETTEPAHYGSWTENSPAVTEQYPYLWAKEVVTFSDNTTTTKYYCIGSRGDNGVDAKDFEWAYIRTKTSASPTILNDNTYVDTNGKDYTADDHLPRVIGDSNVENNGSKYQCTDDPKGVDETWKYEWEIKRTKGGVQSDNSRAWNYYIGAMKLHNNFAESAFVIDLSNDNDQFGTDSNSKVIEAQTRSTAVMLYDGAARQVLNESDGVSAVLKYIDDDTAVPTSVAEVSCTRDTQDTTVGYVRVTFKKDVTFAKSGLYAYITAKCAKGEKNATFTVRKLMSGQAGISPTIYQLAPSQKTFSFGRNASNILTPNSRTVAINATKTTGNTTSSATTSGDGLTYKWGFDEETATSAHSGLTLGTSISVSNTDAASHYQVWVELSSGDKETLPIVKDGTDGLSAQSYIETQEAWSNQETTASADTMPSDCQEGDWKDSTPANTNSRTYLWRRSRKMTLKTDKSGYDAGQWSYTRLSGTNGTSIKTQGTVANTSKLLDRQVIPLVNGSDGQRTDVQDGWAYISEADRHLYQWSDELRSKSSTWVDWRSGWLDLGEFKGESGKTYYTHIAWAKGIILKKDGDGRAVTTDRTAGQRTMPNAVYPMTAAEQELFDFSIAPQEDLTWMGTLVDEDTNDAPDYKYYTWKYVQGADGKNAVRIDLDNQADLVSVDADGKVRFARTVVVRARIFDGAAIVTDDDKVSHSMTKASMKIGSREPSSIVKSNGVVTVQWDFSKGDSVTEQTKTFTLNYGGQGYSEEFTLGTTKSDVIYQLLPSPSEVSFSKGSDGKTLTPSQINIYGGYVKENGGSPVTVQQPNGSQIDSSNYLYYRIKGADGTWGAWTAYPASPNNFLQVASSTTNTDIEFCISTASVAGSVSDSNVVDRENVPIVKDGINGDNGQSTFKSTVFTRTNETPLAPDATYGSYASPNPPESGSDMWPVKKSGGSVVSGTFWHDGIPAGEARLWASTRIFASDGQSPQQSSWTTPSPMTDTADFDVEFSSVANADQDPPTGHPNTNTKWSNTSDDTTVWMATSEKHNGVWSSWQVSKIKGEKGDPGGKATNVSEWFLALGGTSRPAVPAVTIVSGVPKSTISGQTVSWSQGQDSSWSATKKYLYEIDYYTLSDGTGYWSDPYFLSEWAEQGPAGKDAYTVKVEPANMIFTQSMTEDSSGSYPLDVATQQATITVKKGNSNDAVSHTVSIPTGGAVNCQATASGDTITVTGVLGNYTAGRVSVNVSIANGPTFTVVIGVYYNKLGEWKESVIGDTKREIATSTWFDLDANGNIVESDRLGTFVRSSKQNLSRLDEESFINVFNGNTSFPVTFTLSSDVITKYGSSYRLVMDMTSTDESIRITISRGSTVLYDNYVKSYNTFDLTLTGMTAGSYTIRCYSSNTTIDNIALYTTKLSRYSEINQTVNGISTTINDPNTGILKRLDTAEGSITTVTGIVNGHTTSISQLTQTSNSIQSTVTQLQKGKNLLTGVLTAAGWKSGTSVSWNVADAVVDSNQWIAVGSSSHTQLTSPSFAMESGKSYAISFETESTSAVSVTIRKSGGALLTTINTSSGSGRKTATYASTYTGSVYIVISSVKVRYPQVETGSTATAFDAGSVEMSSRIKQTADGITTMVEDVDDHVSIVEQKANSIESTVGRVTGSNLVNLPEQYTGSSVSDTTRRWIPKGSYVFSAYQQNAIPSYATLSLYSAKTGGQPTLKQLSSSSTVDSTNKKTGWTRHYIAFTVSSNSGNWFTVSLEQQWGYPQIETGSTPTPFNIGRTSSNSSIRQTADEIDLSIRDDLESTGINISTGKVAVETNNFTVSKNGTQVFGVDTTTGQTTMQDVVVKGSLMYGKILSGTFDVYVIRRYYNGAWRQGTAIRKYSDAYEVFSDYTRAQMKANIILLRHFVSGTSSNPWTDYDANLIYLPPAKFCEGMEITIITSLFNNAGALGQYFTYAVSNDFATTNPIIENSQLECGNRFAVISQDSNVTTALQNTFEIQDYGVAQSVYLYHVLQTNATKVTFVATRNPFADGFISDSAKLPDCIAWCMIDAKVASNV